MSIFVDESSSAWKDFKNKEKLKFPHFEKDWIDLDGEISGSGHLRDWKWEVNAYLRDRQAFLDQLNSITSTQISRPPTKKKDSPAVEKNLSPPQKQASSIPTRNRIKAANNKIGSSNKGIPLPPTMPRRTRRSQAWKRGRKGRRGGNKALASVRVPFKVVMEVDSAKSSTQTGHWFNHLTISELAGPALKLHEEFKTCSMKVRFIPEDITTGSGLYAACLLDQKGFGDPVQATTVWFPRVADLPGARLCHVTRGCTFSWRPTEPDSRNFRKSHDESNYVVASFYIFGNSTTLSIKGQLLITGLLRARGEFYSANISTRIKALSLLNSPDEEYDDCSKSEKSDFESLVK